MNLEITLRHIRIKLSKVKDKKGILETAREKMICYVKGSQHETIWGFLSRNLVNQKGIGWYIQGLGKKKPVNQEYYIWQNCPWKWRRLTQKNKSWGGSSPPYKNTKKIPSSWNKWTIESNRKPWEHNACWQRYIHMDKFRIP